MFKNLFTFVLILITLSIVQGANNNTASETQIPQRLVQGSIKYDDAEQAYIQDWNGRAMRSPRRRVVPERIGNYAYGVPEYEPGVLVEPEWDLDAHRIEYNPDKPKKTSKSKKQQAPSRPRPKKNRPKKMHDPHSPDTAGRVSTPRGELSNNQ